MKQVSKTDYRRALQSARGEFEKLIQERSELDSRIVRLRQTITGLMGLCEGTRKEPRSINNVIPLPPRFMRLTSAIRQVLANSISGIKPTEIRDELLNRGLNMAQYVNKLAVIHNTLTRLEKQGEVIQISGGWAITDKGRLASRMDALDCAPSTSSNKSTC